MNGQNRISPGFFVCILVVGLLFWFSPAMAAENLTINTTAAPTSTTTLNTSIFPNATTPVNTTVPASTATTVPTTVMVSIPVTVVPPVIILNNPEITNLTAEVSGIAMPGSPNATISQVTWDWGDGTPHETHGFPYSHTYSKPGSYLLSITANQNNGVNVTKNTTLMVPGFMGPSSPVLGPLNPAPSITGEQEQPGPRTFNPEPGPLITLSSPLLEGTNVTINGFITPLGENTTLKGVLIDWGDGKSDNFSQLPALHRYPGSGTYEAVITGIQSDGRTSSKSLVFEVQNLSPQGPSPATPPPGGTPGRVTDSLLVLMAIIVILVLVLTGGILYRSQKKRKEEESGNLPESVTVLAEAYHKAREEGNMAAAAEYAQDCARMLRDFATRVPEKRVMYLEKAALWETIAANMKQLKDGKREASRAESSPDISVDEYKEICRDTDIQPDVLESVVRIAVELAIEGREGKPVGTAFVVGDTRNVMENSKQFVLNPFFGHDERERKITDPALMENVKEFAQLDGAFIVSGDGLVEAAGRYITVETRNVHIPKGMGSRHASVAGITQVTRSVGVVLSQSGGIIKIFKGGKILRTITP